MSHAALAKATAVVQAGSTFDERKETDNLEDHSLLLREQDMSQTLNFVLCHDTVSRHNVVAPFPAAPLLTGPRRLTVGSGTREDVVTMLDEMRVLDAFHLDMYVAIPEFMVVVPRS